jgi:hypothetical protein
MSHKTTIAKRTSKVSILAGGDVSLRYFFIPDAMWSGDGTTAPLLNLDSIHDTISNSSAAARHVKRLTSFYRDVTIPFTTRRRLPVVALVEDFADDASTGASASIKLEIEINATETNWEGKTIALLPARIPALLTDIVTLFDSGHVIYAPAFVLRMSQTTSATPDARGEDRSARLISLLTSLVDSPSAGYEDDLKKLRSKISFKLEGEATGRDLLEFVNDRLALLRAEPKPGNVFSDLLRPVIKTNTRWLQSLKRWCYTQRAATFDEASELKWHDLRSASIEVVGADRFDEVLSWCTAAKEAAQTEAHTEVMKMGPSERALAALAQNILDVDNQDESEVVDSLSQAIATGEDVLLIHPMLTTRYSREARSYTDMRDTLGGCPYFLLTNVAIAYNEYLLERNAQLVDGIRELTRTGRWISDAGASSTKAERADFKARFQLFENHTLYSLPNIFRYPTERIMFDEIVRQRGLSQRAAGIEKFTTHIYQLRKDWVDLEERKNTSRTNGLLIALSVLQVSGLILAALALKELESAEFVLGDQPVRRVFWSLLAGLLVIGFIVGARALLRRFE